MGNPPPLHPPCAPKRQRTPCRFPRLPLRRLASASRLFFVVSRWPMTPYDHVPPDPPTSGEPASPAPYPAYKRSGSQKRRRKYFVQVAFDEAEYADAKARARRVGLRSEERRVG